MPAVLHVMVITSILALGWRFRVALAMLWFWWVWSS
jgi:hypothetical protein